MDKAINGKVKALSEKVTPMVDAYSKWLSWRRGAAIAFGVVLAIGGFISTVQTLWGLLAGHLVVK